MRRAAVVAFGTLGDESHLGEVLRAMKIDTDDMVQRLAMITAAKLAKGTGQAPYVQRQLSMILNGPGKMEGKGFFTKELEDAQLDGRVDIAVHSMKDLTTEAVPGLVIGVRFQPPFDGEMDRDREPLAVGK